MATQQEWIESLRGSGYSDDDIIEILSAADEDEPAQPQGNPRTLSGWKNRARQEAERAAELEAKLAGYEYAAQYSEVVESLPEDLRDFVSAEDLATLSEITPATVRALAQVNYEGALEAVGEEARAYGFPNVESYLEAQARMAEHAQQVVASQQANTDQLQAQAGLTIDAAPAGFTSGVRAQAEEAMNDGDVDRVQEIIRANPQAFAKRLGGDFRPE